MIQILAQLKITLFLFDSLKMWMASRWQKGGKLWAKDFFLYFSFWTPSTCNWFWTSLLLIIVRPHWILSCYNLIMSSLIIPSWSDHRAAIFPVFPGKLASTPFLFWEGQWEIICLITNLFWPDRLPL